MGQRGPLPKLRAVDAAETAATLTKPSRPDPPDWLDDEALAEWDRVVPELDRNGLLSVVDRSALGRYCHLWSQWLAASQQIAVEGVVIEGYRGSMVKNPRVQIQRDTGRDLVALAKELLVTPSARLRTAVADGAPVDDPDDPFD